MPFAASELKMWETTKDEVALPSDDRAIDERYSRGEGRIVIETNREKLPGFVEAMKKPNYMDLRPFYQRRPRWDAKKQSLLIESFIMNIPVPPIFLYEKEFNSYEVMDGQQRVTALKEFYDNNLKLTGLEMWPELNGRLYRNLPDKLQAGIDRRSITSIVLLKESTADEDEALFLRETVFERLNTGGVALERQEIRNALYRTDFNDLLLQLSRLDAFRKAWGLPRYVPDEIEKNSTLLSSSFYSKMGDLELVLRFFALRHADHYTRGMQGFLDLYMAKASKFDSEDIQELGQLFATTLNLATFIYEDHAFRPFDPTNNRWEANPHKAFYDAVMVGLSNHIGKIAELSARSALIVEQTKELFRSNEDGVFTGRGNTKRDVQDRIRLFSEMLERALSSHV
ncbi:hypothetical protein V1286_005160 [Bradyrhizobium algeriense]|uniref:GmrSD restriction endonucleases N-terminal domain-containing protein n=1 Tax=Bradyrhizobium algeriense TaxID=634784 RepID=A0ABU8BHP5_9BRAD